MGRLCSLVRDFVFFLVVDRLREERDLLTKAFSIMGVSQKVDEDKRLLSRVERLEDGKKVGHASTVISTADKCNVIPRDVASTVITTAEKCNGIPRDIGGNPIKFRWFSF